MSVIDGKTATPAYVFNVPDGPDGPHYDIQPLITVGDEVPLLEGEFGSFTTSETETYPMVGIPDGLGYTEIDGLKYVWMNHELTSGVITDNAEGVVNGARVSLYVFDENWNAIGGKNLIEDVELDGVTYSLNPDTGNYEDPDGNVYNFAGHDNFSRFCSAYLASEGFVDENGSIPIYFAPEEVDAGTAVAITPDGTASPIPGFGLFSKEQVYPASQYRADNSDQTVMLSMEDENDGEIYMYVGDQTDEDPNGFNDTTDSLYVLRIKDAEGNIFGFEDMPENIELTAEWVPVPDSVTLDRSPDVLSNWVNGEMEDGELRSTNFRRPEDIHEDPNNPGEFYLVTTGRPERNGSLTEEAETPEEADNPYGKLHRLILNPEDPTGDATFEFLLEGGPETGVSYDNMVVDSNGNVLIQEDETSFGGDILQAEGRYGSVISYNIAENEGVVGNDRVDFLFENSTAFIDPTRFGAYGSWESSGIIEVPEGYLFDVQAGTIGDTELPDGRVVGTNAEGTVYYEGRYARSGQLILTLPAEMISGSGEFVGGDAGEILAGSAEMDTVAGGLGDDLIDGGEGDDVLRGDANSRSSGGTVGGNDEVYGGSGNDRIGGKGGNDFLFGEEGDDQIYGDDGDDLLDGGLGHDTLTGDDFSGGAGRDTFVLATGEGTDVVVDFEVGMDFLGLKGGLMAEELSFTQAGSDTEVGMGSEVLAILEGVNASDLMALMGGDNDPFLTV
ncbi:MAG: alkaline phosphatase PhoX [Lyngbya sp.]|nr:alkaline phosphatase PhoX [Lyngbya sp.]